MRRARFTRAIATSSANGLNVVAMAMVGCAKGGNGKDSGKRCLSSRQGRGWKQEGNWGNRSKWMVGTNGEKR